MEKHLSSPYKKIICLTEESVEVIYRLGLEDLIVGVSVYVERPPQAKLNHPKISHFIQAKYDEIDALKPDLILGFSDIQKDIARDLISRGHNVWIANHRTLTGIIQYIRALSHLLGSFQKGEELALECESKILEQKKMLSRSPLLRPKVYIEEWNGPYITGIKWFSEIVELSGGYDIFTSQSDGVLASERIVTWEQACEKRPDYILSCWCGKKMQLSDYEKRPGIEELGKYWGVSNIQDRIIELPPEIFLQPGPAPILEGIDILLTHFKRTTC